MSRYDTGNPIDSDDARDLDDNAKNFDQAVNSEDATWTDRLGNVRPTVSGRFDELEQSADEFDALALERLQAIGYQTPIDYTSGISFSDDSDLSVSVDESGTIYAIKPSAIPFTTTGVWDDDKDNFYVVQGLIKSDVSSYTNIVFDTVANAKSGLLKDGSTIDLKVGDSISTEGYHSPGDGGGVTYIVYSSGESYDDIITHQISDGLVIKPEIKFNLDAKIAGAYIDGINDDYDNFVAARSFCIANGKVLTWSGSAYSGSNLNLRNVTIDAPNGRIIVDTGDMIILGGNASATTNPYQIIRGAYNLVPQNVDPQIQIRGAKGQEITILGEVQYVQLYADTSTSVYGTDYSIAYNIFNFVRVIKLELTNNESTTGSDTQWINENVFNLKRTNNILINGTYDHNHNIFKSPNIEASSSLLIDIQAGSSNLFYDVRLEGVSTAGINFSEGTWGNYVYSSWMEHPWNRIGKSNPSSVNITDNGNNNAVIYDFNEQMFKVPLVTIDSTINHCNYRQDDLSGLSPSVGKIYPSTNSNSTLAKTDLIPVYRNTTIAGETSDVDGLYRARISCYDSSRTKIQDIDDTDIISAILTSYSDEVMFSTTGHAGWTAAILSDRIAYVDISFTGSFNQTLDDASYSIALSAYYSPDMKYNILPEPNNCSIVNAECIPVSQKPTKVSAKEGTLFLAPTDSWHVVSRTVTENIGLASLGHSTLTLDSVTGMSAGDIIAATKTNGFTFWTTIASISGSVVTLSDTLDGPVQNGRIQTVRLST